MTTDITELAQSHELRNKVNHRLYGALEFQGTSGEHATITLSIDECKSIIAALDERLTLVEALEKAQQRISELESSTFTFEVTAEPFTCPRCGTTTTHPEGWHYCHKREAE